MSHAVSGPGTPQNRVLVPDEILNDLKKSGLVPSDMKIRQLGPQERATTGCGVATRGYVIPYFEMDGLMLPFYRVKVLNPDEEVGAKYKQPRSTPNHIYFPPDLEDVLHTWCKKHPSTKLIVITEGEKKAACAVKMGIPCIALGGVDSWRSKTIILPKESELTATKKSIRAKLPSTDVTIPEMQMLAQGFGSLIDKVLQHGLTPIIIYDSDRNGTLKSEVQRAATMLAYEFRYLGIKTSQVKQVILPDIYTLRDQPDGDPSNYPKTGLDDFLMARGAAPLIDMLIKAHGDPEAFPMHPNPRGFLNVHLNGLQDRRSLLQISSVVLSELDAAGIRFREKHSGKPYYFDRSSHKLMPAQIVNRGGEVMHETPFGTLLYQKFGLTAVDNKVLLFLASQFTGEEPIKEVTPRRIRTLITEKEDPTNPFGLALQISDSQFLAISPDPKKPVELCTNGTKSILFEQDHVEPLDVDYMFDLFDQYRTEAPTLTPWWREVLEDTNLGKTFPDVEGGITTVTEEGRRMRDYATLLFYISPFLNRWKGAQMPVELMIGEAGSGKSSIFNMRLQVMTGRPHLRNIPSDLKDWNASVTNSGGLLVFDNVHFTKRDLKQQISDEVCRLITEPVPHVELRKYFTTNELVRIPVDVSFAFTAINQPFQNADLFQRAAIFHFIKLGQAPDGDWVLKKIEEKGGREAWVAHHLVFLHRFLRIAAHEGPGGWNPEYKSSHRLSHFEQCLEIAGRILGIKAEWAGEVIQKTQDRTLTEADWTFEAITCFVTEMLESNPGIRFMARDVYEWGLGQTDFCENPIMSNVRKLGRYMANHNHQLMQSLGIIPAGIAGNAMKYRLVISDKTKERYGVKIDDKPA